MSNMVVELLLRAKDLMSDKVRAGADAVKAFSDDARSGSQAVEQLGESAQRSAEGLEKSSSSTQLFSGGLTKMKLAALAAVAAVAGIVSKVGDWVAAASKQEIAETKLETTLRNVTGATDEQIQSLKDQAAALQKVSTYGDEVTISAQAMLGTFGLTADQIQQITPGLLDMAAAMDQTGQGTGDLNGQAIALGKALTEGIGSLTRYGVTISDAQKQQWELADQTQKVAMLTEILAGNFGGLAESVGKTFAGAMQQANNAAGDAREEMGKLFTQSDAWRGLVNKVTGYWQEIGAGVKGSGDTFEWWSDKVVRVLGGAGSGIKFFWNSVQIIFKTGAMAIAESAALVASAMSKITFGELSNDLSRQADELRQTAAGLRAGIVEDAYDASAALKGIGHAFTGAASEADTAAHKVASAGQSFSDAGMHAEASAEKVRQLVAQFDEMAKKGKDAKEALKAIFEGLKPDSIESVKALGLAMQQLQDDGKLTADVIRNQLGDALSRLSGADLQAFQRSAAAAFGGIEEHAIKLALLLDGSLSAALKRLGVDAHELETGITTAGQDILDTFNAIATNAEASGKQIGAAFEQALGKLNKKEELEALRVSLKKVFDDSKLSADEYKRKLEELDRKLLGLKDTAEDKVAQAFKLLGIESKKSLEAAAKAAKDAFDTIRNSGTTAPEDIAKAFLTYAKTAIEANNGVISSQLAAQAATLGLEGALTGVVSQLEKQSQAQQQIQAGIQQIGDKLGATLADADREIIASVGVWEKFWGQVRENFYGLSDAVGEAYDLILERTIRVSGELHMFWRRMTKQTNQLTDAYNDQLGMFDQLLARIESGTLSARELETAALSAAGGFSLMGSERLDQLRGALDDALRKLEELEASSQRTLDSLQDRLDRLKGDELSIQRRASERERGDIERQLAEARKYGSRDAVTDLEQALALLDQISRAEVTRIREQQSQRTQSQRPVVEERSVQATINVHGVTEPEAVARLIEPKLRSIWARKA